MIKLNLLPESYKNRYKIRAKRLAFILAFLFLITILFSWTFYSYVNIRQKALEYKALVNEYKVVLKRAKSAEEIKKKVDKYKEELLFLVSLLEKQPLMSRVLNDLGTYIPDDTWITKFSYFKGKGFLIRGYSLSSISPTKFVDNLSRSNYFIEIELEDAKQDGKVYAFSIVGKFSFE